MSASAAKAFNLPWHQYDRYWISIYPATGVLTKPVLAVLKQCGAVAVADEGYALETGRAWKSSWEPLYASLKAMDALAQIEVALTMAERPPASRQEAGCKAPVVVQTIAESLWLGDALMDDRVMCYLQSVHSSKERIFGYESFARVRKTDGTVIGGDKVIAASKVLGIEYMIDRHLHIEAIKTFAASECNGFLFINFLPGFIHRPSVYLEGLSETAKQYGIISKHIVLEFTNCEKPRDLNHIRSVCEYGRSRGYSVALDDLSTLGMARTLISEIRPDFVKIDLHLVRQVESLAARDTIRGLVALTHESGGAVVAEGVETEAYYEALKGLGVDLFQGYHFAAPAPVEAVLNKRSGAAF